MARNAMVHVGEWVKVVNKQGLDGKDLIGKTLRVRKVLMDDAIPQFWVDGSNQPFEMFNKSSNDEYVVVCEPKQKEIFTLQKLYNIIGDCTINLSDNKIDGRSVISSITFKDGKILMRDYRTDNPLLTKEVKWSLANEMVKKAFEKFVIIKFSMGGKTYKVVLNKSNRKDTLSGHFDGHDGTIYKLHYLYPENYYYQQYGQNVILNVNSVNINYNEYSVRLFTDRLYNVTTQVFNLSDIFKLEK